jgi:heme/copper-type cytochrome/quinol oxidase subunit 2
LEWTNQDITGHAGDDPLQRDRCLLRAEQRRNIITTITTITPPVTIVMMVTVALYCYGRRERACPGKRGPSWPKSNMGGASAAFR